MEIDTISLSCFVAVADTGSFTKAAKKVGRSQSAVSQQIVKLESMIDKQLFYRGKLITLTSDGETFLNHARQILKMHYEIVEHFKSPELYGEVRFGIPEDIASIFLQDVLAEFIQAHPKIALHIDCDLSLNLYQKFKDNELDMVIIKTKDNKEFPQLVELSSEKLMWFGDENLLQESQVIPLILSPDPCVYRSCAIKALEKANLKWRIAFSSHSYASKVAAVKAGIGITLMPYRMGNFEKINHINPGLLPSLENSYVSLLKKQTDNKAINSFEDFIIKHC